VLAVGQRASLRTADLHLLDEIARSPSGAPSDDLVGETFRDASPKCSKVQLLQLEPSLRPVNG
jgi:hypothetical protein